MPNSLAVPCHCCGGDFVIRTELDEIGLICCPSWDDYCINCLRCQRHCTCGGKRVREYYVAWWKQREALGPAGVFTADENNYADKSDKTGRIFPAVNDNYSADE